MNVIGQYIHGSSPLHRIDARIKLVDFIFILTAVVMSNSLWQYGFALAVTALIVALSGLPLKITLSSVKHLWVFFIVIFAMNAVFFEGETLVFSYGILRIYEEGIWQGVKIAVNIVLIMISGNVLTLTTPPMDITSALTSLMSPLRFLRIPVEDIAVIISAAVQFIPALTEEADMIKKAQTARGARFESKKITEKAASYLPLMIPMFIASFRRADELSTAMESRGYTNAKNRTKKEPRPLKSSDIAALIAGTAICAAQIFAVSLL